MRWMLSVMLLSVPVAVLARTPETDGKQWSLRPRSRPDVPRFTDPAKRQWPRHAIDAFILDKLRQARHSFLRRGDLLS